jgi:hypothetical protein
MIFTNFELEVVKELAVKPSIMSAVFTKHYPNNKRIKERAVIHDAAVKWAKRARRK